MLQFQPIRLTAARSTCFVGYTSIGLLLVVSGLLFVPRESLWLLKTTTTTNVPPPHLSRADVDERQINVSHTAVGAVSTFLQSLKSGPVLSVNQNKTHEIATASQPAPYFSQLAMRQIENYRKGEGLIINIHVTHHGGTTLCQCVGRASNAIREAPSFACMKPHGVADFPPKGPWSSVDTDRNIDIIRKSFHLVSWELGKVPKLPLNSTDFENEKLVSILIMRHPISRALAGDGTTSKLYPDIRRGNATEATWWDFARNYKKADNFALARLAGHAAQDFSDATYLLVAKRLVRRMTFVLDLECLSDGIEMVAEILGLTTSQQCKRRQGGKHRPTIEDRIPFPDVLDYMRSKNQLDIELYQWSKRLSLLKCADLSSS